MLRKYNSYIVLALAVILTCAPRFNGNNYLIDELVGEDAAHYVAMTELYKTGKSNFVPLSPFTYRPLIPYLASKLPFTAITAINIINVSCLILGAIYMYLLIRNISGRKDYALFGGLLYTISFPVFYYGSIGYVDPAAISLMSIASYYMYQRKWMYFLAILFLAGFVKETIILVIPIAFIFLLINHTRIAVLLGICTSMISLYLLSTYIARSISIDPNQVIWAASPNIFFDNISRSRTWVSFLLGFGIPGILATYLLIKSIISKQWSILLLTLPWVAGVGLSLSLFVVSILSAYSDGRFIWPSTVYAIPLIFTILSQTKPLNLRNQTYN